MEDSSQFLQWALSTLQHEQPPATPATAYDNGCDAVSSIPVLGYAAAVDRIAPGEPQRDTNSWSSVDTDTGSGGGSSAANGATAPRTCSSGTGTDQPVSWDFINPALAQLIQEAYSDSAAAASAARAERGGVPVPQMAQRGSPPTRRASARISALSSSAPYAHSQDHIIAERKRREKINQRFIELSAVIPGLKKMDKATILADATRHVRELQEKLKALQQDGSGSGRAMESATLVKENDDEDGGGAPSFGAAGPAATRNDALPEIEARISEGNVVMVRIHCRDAKGVLVRLLAEVEGLNLSITHTNVMPFPASILIIKIMAKVEVGFNATADGIVARLNAVLHECVRDSAEQTRSWG